MLTQKRILITGASGYLGSWLAEYAKRHGAHVRILLRKIEPHLKEWTSKFEIFLGDITNLQSLSGLCKGIDIVWHAASANETICNTDFAKALEINVTGVHNLMETACLEHVSTFVKLSTFHTYGFNGKDPITEELVPSPNSAYGLTNLMGDFLALYFYRSKKINVIIPRISNGYGAPLFKEINRWTLVINDLCRMAFEKREIVLKSSGLQQRDFVSIPDIFLALSILSTKPTKGRIFHVGGSHSQSILDIARLVKRVYDKRFDAKINFFAPKEQFQSVPSPVLFDISKLKSLGYQPKNIIEQEIQKTFSLLEK